jgi:Zn-finger domain-containing protein
MDDAFLSRISVSITYPELDVTKQKSIWHGFLKKLEEEKKDISLTDRAKKFLEGLDKDERTKNVPWNGREIRNGM